MGAGPGADEPVPDVCDDGVVVVLLVGEVVDVEPVVVEVVGDGDGDGTGAVV